MKKYSIILTAIITCTVIAGCYNPSVEGGPCHEITGQCTGSLVCTVVENRHVCTALGDGTEGSACGTAAPCGPGFSCVLQDNSSVCLTTENRPGGACVPERSTCPEDYPCSFNNGSYTCSPPAIGSEVWNHQSVSVNNENSAINLGNFQITTVHYHDGEWILGGSCGNIFASTNEKIMGDMMWERVYTISSCSSQSVNAIHQSGSTWRAATDAEVGIIRCTGNCTSSSSWPEDPDDTTANDGGANVYSDDSNPESEPDQIADIYSWGDHWVAVTRAMDSDFKIFVYDEADEISIPRNSPRWLPEGFAAGIFTGRDDNAGGLDTLNAVHYGGGYWVAVGGVGEASVVYTSLDSNIKNIWVRTTKTNPNQSDLAANQVQDDVGNAALVDVHYGGTTWVAIGTGSLITGTVANGTFDWNEVSLNIDSTIALKDVHYDDGTWIVVGDGGTILRSTDGKNWASVTNLTITDQNLNAVYYAPGTWVAVGDMGTIITSEDGMVWTTVSSDAKNDPVPPLPVTQTLRDVHYGGGIWVIVGGDADGPPIILAQYTPNFVTSIQ